MSESNMAKKVYNLCRRQSHPGAIRTHTSRSRT